jgi:CHASE2 domain-containing protein
MSDSRRTRPRSHGKDSKDGASPPAAGRSPGLAKRPRQGFVRRVWNRIPQNLRPFVIQAAVIGLFHMIEVWAEDTRFFVEVRRIGFDWATSLTKDRGSRQLDEAAPPVVIVDITSLLRSNIDPAAPPTLADHSGYTSRVVLQQIVDKLAEFQPAAIGFDIDLSGDRNINGGVPPDGHEDFLDECLRLSSPKPDLPPGGPGGTSPRIPIFLGVGRGALTGRKVDWLGEERYAELAAGVFLASSEHVLDPPIYSLLPLQFFYGKRDATALPSLSFALSHSLHPVPAKPSGLKRWLFTSSWQISTDTEDGNPAKVEVCYLNFDLLPSLKNAVIAVRTLLADAAAHNDLDRKIRGKIVLVGDADFERTADKIIVPGQRNLVPGVFVHAAGVLTLLSAPLWQFEPDWHFGIEWGWLAGAVVGGVISWFAHLLAERLAPEIDHHLRVELIQFTLAVVGVILVTIFFAMAWSVLWTACIASAVGMGVETFTYLWLLPYTQPHPDK